MHVFKLQILSVQGEEWKLDLLRHLKGGSGGNKLSEGGSCQDGQSKSDSE